MSRYVEERTEGDPGAGCAGGGDADGYCRGLLRDPQDLKQRDTAQWSEVYSAVFPPHPLLIESYAKAQEVATINEKLNSMQK